MGFPNWTLWGMGMSGFAALLFMTLAYIAQSPALAARFRYLGPRLVKRSRALTGYGLAGLLMMLGFFLAGAPLEPVEPVTEVLVVTAIPDPEEMEVAVMVVDQAVEVTIASDDVSENDESGEETAESIPEETPQSESGAFARPATREDGVDATETFTPTPFPDETAVGTPTETAIPSNTATPTETATPSNTPTPSATPTATATPTLTPTRLPAIRLRFKRPLVWYVCVRHRGVKSCSWSTGEHRYCSNRYNLHLIIRCGNRCVRSKGYWAGYWSMNY